MTHPNISTAMARVIVDELASQGLDMVVISPGSRSAALAIAAAQHLEVETRVFIDERSAAFHALGVSRASGAPAAVVSTSGSALANFFPAIVEADMSCVPLVVVSADRPAELQGVGANQTIDQVHMFGSKVRAYAGFEMPDAGEDANAHWRATVARLIASATGPRPGPVHLNVRFSEPTVPVSDDGRTKGTPYLFETPRIGDGVSTTRPNEDLVLPTLDPERGLVIAGDGQYDREALSRRAADLGWPVLATAMSGMRGGPVITTYHHLLADGVKSGIRPETVVAVGSIGPSSRLESLVATASRRIRVDRWGRSIDPGRNATLCVQGDVADVLARVKGHASPNFSAVWFEADRQCRDRINAILEADGRMTGASAAAEINRVDWSSLVVASSLPIREVDAHLLRPGAVFANRGASGIDGFVSTALGVASRHHRTLALAGDLSLLHDSNGFIHDGSIDLTAVVLDNQGGGLFDSLPPAVHAPDYERLFVTNPQRSLEDLAHFHGLRYHEAGDRKSLRRLVDKALDRSGVDLIRVPVDRTHDLAVRSQLDG